VDSAIGSVYDPYENTQVEINKITNNHKTLVKEVDCIYTYDKQLLTEDNNTLGSVYSLIIYMRADDVPKDILKEKNAIIIELNGIDFIVKSFQPSYDIIIQADLRR
jgi:archaellum component FlaC